MSVTIPFSLRIFVADGDPDGLRLVERSNWIGKAVVFPRALLPSIKKRDEFGQTGVYLLLGPRGDGEGDMLYIGEGDPVRDRLEAHYGQKDFWTRAVFFVAGAGQLNKAHVKFLESRLLQLAKAARRMTLDNRKDESEPTLSEADRADMLVFLENMLGMLPVLGIHAFEQASSIAAVKGDAALTCNGKGVSANGYEATQGFVVMAGSQAVGEEVASMQQYASGAYELRQELIKNGILKNTGERYLFEENYVFSSPSTAAGVVLGCSVNGRTVWKNGQGITLKKLQAREVAEAAASHS